MSETNKTIWTKNFIILFTSNAILWMAFEMLTPTLPLYLEKCGASPFQIGLIIGILTLSAMIIRPFTSSMLLFLNKQYILFISILVCVLATGSYLLTTSLLLLFFFRVVHGLGFGIATVYYATLTADNLPDSHLGEGMGYFGIGESVCLSVGPILGVAMLNKYDFSGMFFSSALISLFAGLLLLRLTGRSLPNSEEKKSSSEPKAPPKKITFKLLEKRVLSQSLLMLLNGIIIGGVISFIALYANERGITNIAWFFFISALIGVVIRVLSGKIYDKKGPFYVLLPAGLCLMVGLILISFSTSELQINLAALFYGIGIGPLFSVLLAWTMTTVDNESREDAMSSFLNFFDFGVGGGAIFLGVIAQVSSYQFMYLLLAVIAGANLLATLFLTRVKKNQAA
ncbi:MAG: MFS transporter [Peptococcaceae bacterium]|nr:MFS transporter [Peptococcaceae bacterium]